MSNRIGTLVLLAMVQACSPSANVMRDTTAPRFLALGDSYTIGESVPVAERWPVQLMQALRGTATPVDEPLIIAQTGWTTDELDAAIDSARVTGTFSLVTLLIGVNDQYRGREAEAYRAPFRKLLDRAIGFAGGSSSRVIVISIPDWGITPFAEGRDRVAIAAAIDRFNAVNRDETHKAGARYVDIAPASRAATSDRSLIAADGLHPSGRMYREWTAIMLPAAKSILRVTP